MARDIEPVDDAAVDYDTETEALDGTSATQVLPGLNGPG
jgi:hypothetical protein